MEEDFLKGSAVVDIEVGYIVGLWARGQIALAVFGLRGKYESTHSIPE
jgi:hypothetical protein